MCKINLTEIKRDEKLKGKGLFAIKNIKKGEIILDWSDSVLYKAKSPYDLPGDLPDHAIQISKNEWADHPVARNANHSCSPNTGIKGLTSFVCLKDIKKGEEIFWDYGMTEDSDWIMPEKCLCGEKDCRVKISSYSALSKKLQENYKKNKICSIWLLNKYAF
jgi:uncharacterized protein